jgi:hypothetical protein
LGFLFLAASPSFPWSIHGPLPVGSHNSQHLCARPCSRPGIGGSEHRASSCALSSPGAHLFPPCWDVTV